MRQYPYRPGLIPLVTSVVLNALMTGIFTALALGWYRELLAPQDAQAIPEWLNWGCGVAAAWSAFLCAFNLAGLARLGGNRDMLRLTDMEMVLPGTVRDGRERRLLWEGVERAWLVPGMLILRCGGKNHRVLSSFLPGRTAFAEVVQEVRKRVRPEVAARLAQPPGTDLFRRAFQVGPRR